MVQLNLINLRQYGHQTSKIAVQKCSQQTPMAKTAEKFGLIGIELLQVMFRNTTIRPMAIS